MNSFASLPTPPLWSENCPWIDAPNPDIEGYVAALPTPPAYDLRQKLTEWHANGFVVFRREVSDALIDWLLSDIDHLRENFKEYDIAVRIRAAQMPAHDLDSFPENMTRVKLNHLHCYSRAAAQISLSRNVVDFLGHIFSSPPTVLQSLTFWQGSEQPTHIDYPYVNQQKKLPYMAASWTALESIKRGSGPLLYFPGGHKVDMSGFYDWGDGAITMSETSQGTPLLFADYLNQRMAEKGIKPAVFYPKKGDVLIWHANLPHQGMPVTKPKLTRKSYVTHFTSEAHIPDWLKNEVYTDGPKATFHNGASAYIEPSLYQSKKLPSWDGPRPESSAPAQPQGLLHRLKSALRG